MYIFDTPMQKGSKLHGRTIYSFRLLCTVFLSYIYPLRDFLRSKVWIQIRKQSMYWFVIYKYILYRSLFQIYKRIRYIWARMPPFSLLCWDNLNFHYDMTKEPGPFKVPTNYEEFVWKRYFPMSEWDQNWTRSSVAIDINTRLSLEAIMYPLWLPRSHNMADFHAFWTYFTHLSHTVVTVIIKTGTFGALNLRYT